MSTLKEQLLEALMDVMGDQRFRELPEATALSVGLDAADMWRDRLDEIGGEDGDVATG